MDALQLPTDDQIVELLHDLDAAIGADGRYLDYGIPVTLPALRVVVREWCKNMIVGTSRIDAILDAGEKRMERIKDVLGKD